MSAPATGTGTDSEGQVKFLVNCIRFSNQGKIDYDAVAKECGIVSKAAAAKRFSRILLSHGMKAGDLAKGGPVSTGSPSQTPTGTPKTPAKSAGKSTPKAKSTGKRAAAASPTSNTKRARAKLASHPAVASYHDEDDEEEQDEFKVKKEEPASANTGSYHEKPRDCDRDDDDLQLLYVVEKTNGCPVHDTGEYRDAADGDKQFQA
ncbi:hypothetical protein CkaCkLH20_04869 [Colletotrichum karsti]|uniref:Myb-like DNA-binding domain-containing protein n=1 Tax=Colletotrichum karsti TaxID=1095194 RepID=A0A9P6I857_9PEZI|nr:uncharacterized protein CkaCkLH20_04869 [Colletotrichum karsti]KAF9877734.1 hypothetical protein CkaCkLH20_04869 [Colletotrichum karsti]